MSRTIARVVFAVLISFIIIAAAASPNVQASLGSIFQKAGANTSATTSIFADNQTLEQGTMDQFAPESPQFDKSGPSDSSGGCNSDPSLDY